LHVSLMCCSSFVTFLIIISLAIDGAISVLGDFNVGSIVLCLMIKQMFT
jgi:hypothetical protein